jgi:hypothetical protein
MTLQAKDFGIVGDGETDNTAGLIALRDTIRAGADRIWRVEFEPGHYCYSDNRWANFGDRSVVLELNHSIVECFADALLPLGTGPLAWDVEYPTRKTSANGERLPGHLIETVAVGSREVRLKEAVAGRLVPGDAVLVAGDIQQTRVESDGSVWNWGWPPNFRHFEYKTVAAVADEFTLRFVDPFRQGYQDAWTDFPANTPGQVRFYGAPRLWRCRHDDGRQVNRALTIRDARFIGGRHRAAGTKTALAANGLHVTLESCSTSDDNAFWPTVAGRVDLIDCRLARMEMDKIVESVRMDGGEIYGGMSSGGAGVLEARFKDVRFYGFVQVTPRRSWVFDQCQAYDGVMMSKGLTNTPFVLTGAASDR